MGTTTRAKDEKKKVKPKGEGRFVLLALLNEGPLTLKELEEKTRAFVSNFDGVAGVVAHALHAGTSDKRTRRHEKRYDARGESERLAGQGLIVLDEAGKYELTKEGREAAEASLRQLEGLLSSKEAARNTTFADFFLASMKLTVALLSGSVGLLSDAADATVDTASAAVVWAGVKMKKEALGTAVIITMMFASACTIGYESVTKLIEALQGTLASMAVPYLVMGTEAVALVSAIFLHVYQRAAGRRSGSLTLISQSVDSRNHIFISTAVIAGAAFSIVGVRFVDALIGLFIAARFVLDGVDLTKEALSSKRGEELDLSKYRLPLEESWRRGRMEGYREWMLYSLKEEKQWSKEEIVDSLRRTFQPQYVPIVSELGIEGKPFDFEAEFDDLLKPLLEKRLVATSDGSFSLTSEGRKWVAESSRVLRYRRNE
jgi:divalent metal cation (Fe/Co/Zn/Cd) transporter